MPVTIANVTPSKTGGSLRVMIGGSWYGANKDSGLAKGMIIEPTIETGKFGPWIKAWKAAEGTTLPGPTPEPIDERNPPPEGSPTPPEAPRRTQNAGMGIAPYFLPFVSNTVNAAIAAGLIKTPVEIGAWAKAAAEAAVALDSIAGA